MSDTQLAAGVDFGGRAREKDLVGVIGIVQIQILLDHRDTGLARELHRGIAGHARQHELLTWRKTLAVGHQKKVGAQALGQVAVDVQQHGVAIVRLG